MLNIDVNVQVRKVRYPVIFDNNTCTKCGAQGTLGFVDIFGKDAKQEIHPLERIQCKKCGAKYGIQWNKEPDGKMIPTPTDYDVVSMFNNLINHKKIKTNGSNVLP